MVIRMRHTRAHTKNRRSHHKAVTPTITTDTKTGATHVRHRASAKTGTYRGRTVVDMVKKTEKKQARAAKKAEGAR